jgi:arylsulfatase A
MSIGHYPYCPTPDDSAFSSWNPDPRISDTIFFSSMMHYMDKKVRLILSWLHAKGLDTNTIVLFAGDNGTPNEIYYNANGINDIRGKRVSQQKAVHMYRLLGTGLNTFNREVPMMTLSALKIFYPHLLRQHK